MLWLSLLFSALIAINVYNKGLHGFSLFEKLWKNITRLYPQPCAANNCSIRWKECLYDCGNAIWARKKTEFGCGRIFYTSHLLIKVEYALLQFISSERNTHSFAFENRFFVGVFTLRSNNLRVKTSNVFIEFLCRHVYFRVHKRTGTRPDGRTNMLR